MSINLFISLYNEKNKSRRDELHECLMNNLKSNLFTTVWIIAEADENNKVDYISNYNVQPYIVNVLPCTVRPTFETFFDCINRVTADEDINIIANSDIYFKEIQKLPKKNECFALTRYDTVRNGPTTFLDRKDSQDAWFFNGKIRKPQFAAMHMGIPGVDNRCAWELMNIGYEVTNPSLTIKTFHIHAGEKSYDGTKRINRPYHFIYPSE